MNEGKVPVSLSGRDILESSDRPDNNQYRASGISNGIGSTYAQRPTRGRFSPGHNLTVTIGGIAIAETIAMIFVYFNRSLPYYQQVLLDTAVMTAIIFPLLYFLSTRPLLQHIQQRIQTEKVLQARLRLIQFARSHTLHELIQATLDEIELLTNSTISYFHFLEPDQKTLKLQAWSTNTLQGSCAGWIDEGHRDVDQAGIWADCIRKRTSVIHNQYASLPNRKGLPDGHVPLIREMAVPIMRDDRIEAVLGVGNNSGDYTSTDVDLVSTFAEFALYIIDHKQAGDSLRESEEKFRTLVDWTYDWEIWLNPQGNIIYNSPSCKRITGYRPEAFNDDPKLLFQVVHQEDRSLYEKHQALVHDENAGVEKVEFRIIDSIGNEHWLEHICRPLFDENNRYLGRRVSNRDVTERKKVENDIRERNQKEKMLTQTIHTMQLDIARDLHDTIGQNISFLRMKLDYLSGKSTVKKADMQNELKTMVRAANESYDLIRGTLAVLQSDENADLSSVFSRYVEQIEERSAVQVNFSSNGNPRTLSAHRMRQLFYIFREALNNIEKHAEADQVTITIGWGDGSLGLTVADNGKGFDPLNIHYGNHYGLKFMRDRAEILNGSLNINSVVGSGTILEVQVPYE